MRHIIFIALIITLITSCKKDTPQSLILGKWQYVGVENNGVLTPADETYFYEFRDGGVLIFTDSDGNKENMTYQFIEDVLYLNGVSISNYYYDITENTLYLKDSPTDNIVSKFEKR